MATKVAILEQIGERSLLLPDLISRGLAANDRLKYYFSLLRAAQAYAQGSTPQVADLRTEREASGICDSSLDAVVGGSRMATHDAAYIPGVAGIIDQVFADVRQMLEPVATAAVAQDDLKDRAALYARRLDEQRARAPATADNQISITAIESLVRLPSDGHDSAHQLVMDLNWELSRLETTISVELLDGAHVYGLQDSDRSLVLAFMKGLNKTAGLKFDHPGLQTTATRDADHLSIHNDLGVTDAHVVVLHITGLVATLIYTDSRRPRMQFVRDLLEPYKITWTTSQDIAADFEMNIGVHHAEHEDALERFLAFVGSRLVFLIDWNRARKRLARFVKKSDALELLKWAADNNIGHEAFLDAGDTKLIRSALERATAAQVQYGARLDEILGRDAAKRFLMSVFRIVSAGRRRGCSPRLIDDEIEAELLTYLQRSDRSLLSAVADHATIIAGMVEGIRRAVVQLKAREAIPDYAKTAIFPRSWKADADTIVRRANRAMDRSHQADHLRRLLSEGDGAVKILDDAAFLLTLVSPKLDGSVIDLLDELTDVAGHATREYVRCLEDARDLSRTSTRPDLERFLVTVDRLASLQDSCEAAERALLERMLRGPVIEFREMYAISEVTRRLDRATDAIVRSGLLVRDYVLSIAPGA